MTASDSLFVTLSPVPVKAGCFHLFGNRLISVTNRNYSLLTSRPDEPVKGKCKFDRDVTRMQFTQRVFQIICEPQWCLDDAGSKEAVCCCFLRRHKVSEAGAQDRGKGYYMINISSQYHHQLITIVCMFLCCSGNECIRWKPPECWGLRVLSCSTFCKMKD